MRELCFGHPDFLCPLEVPGRGEHSVAEREGEAISKLGVAETTDLSRESEKRRGL